MKSVRSLIQTFRDRFDTEDSPTRNRLYEAFKTLDDNINELAGGGSSGTKYYIRATTSVGPTIPTGVPTALPFDVISKEAGGMHSTTTQNTRFTITRGGNYIIQFNAEWPIFAVAAIPLTLQIQVNGASIIGSNLIYSPAVGAILDQQVVAGDYLNIGDYIEIIITQTSGGPLVIPLVANFSPVIYIQEN